MNTVRSANALILIAALTWLSALGVHPCCQAAGAQHPPAVEACHGNTPADVATAPGGHERPGAPNRVTPAYCAMACATVDLVAGPSRATAPAAVPAPVLLHTDLTLPLFERPLDHVPLA